MKLDRRKTLLAAGAVLAAPAIIRSRPARAAAPMLGPARPSFYRFQLGDFEVTTLLDGAVQLEGPHPIFGENQSAEEVLAFAHANFLPGDQMEISFTPILVNTGDHLVLFDSGNAAGRRPGAGNLVAAIEAAGYTADQIDTVIITHMHGDHIGGLMSEGVPTYANAAYATGQVEYDFWSHDDRLGGEMEGRAQLVRSNVVPLAEKTRFVGDNAEIVPGITGIAAFGHTPGHMAYHIESNGQRLMLWADASNHYLLSVQQPEWHVRFDMDKEAAVATRKRLFDMAHAERIPVTGYHMPFPAVGFVDKTADGGYRWVQASYQLNL